MPSRCVSTRALSFLTHWILIVEVHCDSFASPGGKPHSYWSIFSFRPLSSTRCPPQVYKLGVDPLFWSPTFSLSLNPLSPSFLTQPRCTLPPALPIRPVPVSVTSTALLAADTRRIRSATLSIQGLHKLLPPSRRAPVVRPSLPFPHFLEPRRSPESLHSFQFCHSLESPHSLPHSQSLMFRTCATAGPLAR